MFGTCEGEGRYWRHTPNESEQRYCTPRTFRKIPGNGDLGILIRMPKILQNAQGIADYRAVQNNGLLDRSHARIHMFLRTTVSEM